MNAPRLSLAEQAYQDATNAIRRKAADLLAEGQSEGAVLEYCRQSLAEVDAYLAVMRPAFEGAERVCRRVEALSHSPQEQKQPPFILPKPTGGTTGGRRRRGGRAGGQEL